MRINELTEALDRNDDITKGLIEIKHNCQPYLQAINYNVHKYPLYRGVKYEDDKVIIKQVRLDDRRPQDFNIYLHQLLNDYFIDKFREPFRNAMFSTSTPYAAENFGKLYLVFPAGKFTFLWSKKVKDLQVENEDRLSDIIGSANNDFAWERREEEILKQTSQYLNSLEYQNTDLLKAIESKHEIAFRCKEYYGIRINPVMVGQAGMDNLMRMFTDELKR